MFRKSSAVLCGPPILLEMEINYPYLHGWPQKYRSAGMWADLILGSRTLLITILVCDILFFSWQFNLSYFWLIQNVLILI